MTIISTRRILCSAKEMGEARAVPGAGRGIVRYRCRGKMYVFGETGAWLETQALLFEYDPAAKLEPKGPWPCRRITFRSRN